MCNCIKEMLSKTREKFPGCEKVSFDNMELLSGKIFSDVSVTMPGAKKPRTFHILHTFCPICGKRYEELPAAPAEDANEPKKDM